jgi:hypothetical protein
MKLSELKSVVKEAVREAIQEELKDILLEAIKTPKTVVTEHATYQPITSPINVPGPMNPMAQKSREELRDSYRNILGETAATFNSSNFAQPLQITTLDTANGSLPSGEVGMDLINSLMQGKV